MELISLSQRQLSAAFGQITLAALFSNLRQKNATWINECLQITYDPVYVQCFQ